MNNEKTTQTDTATEHPAAPNGHGTKNGAVAQKPDAEASVRKRKKKRPSAEAAKAPVTEPGPETPTTNAEQTAQPAPDDAAQAQPVEEPATEPTTEPATAPAAATTEPAATTAEPIADATPDGLRLRMKVWTDPTTSKRYLMPTAFMRDVVNGQPVSDVMYAYAMSDDDTRLVLLRASEWNALPFYYFQEVGSAPRASARPVDVVVSSGSVP